MGDIGLISPIFISIDMGKPYLNSAGKTIIPPTQGSSGASGSKSSISFTTPTGGGTAYIGSPTLSNVTFNTSNIQGTVSMPSPPAGTMYHLGVDNGYTVISCTNKRSYYFDRIKASINNAVTILNIWDDLMQILYFLDIGVCIPRKNIIQDLHASGNKSKQTYIDIFLKTYILHNFLIKEKRGLYKKIKSISKEQTGFMFEYKKMMFDTRIFNNF